MCYIQTMGGLGNQLFQIATAYAHSRRYGTELHISLRTNCKRSGVTYWDTFLHNFAKNTCLTIPKSIQSKPLGWHERHFHYIPIPKPANTLHGYFQSSKYFADYSDDLRRLFEPAESVKQEVAEKYHNILAEDRNNYCVIHVRRGDYIACPDFHCVIKPEWYERALATVQERNPNMKFLVFSDDIPWCQTLPYFKDACFIDEPTDYMALHLMSQFKHFIISNSSFSWWAVWLGEPSGIVVAPDKWFGPSGPKDYQDIYEPNWIKMAV